MNKTLLRALVVAIQPREGGAVLIVELDERTVRRLAMTPAAWRAFMRARAVDDVLGHPVEIDYGRHEFHLIDRLAEEWRPFLPTEL